MANGFCNFCIGHSGRGKVDLVYSCITQCSCRAKQKAGRWAVIRPAKVQLDNEALHASPVQRAAGEEQLERWSWPQPVSYHCSYAWFLILSASYFTVYSLFLFEDSFSFYSLYHSCFSIWTYFYDPCTYFLFPSHRCTYNTTCFTPLATFTSFHTVPSLPAPCW